MGEQMTEFQRNLIRMWDSLRDKHNDAPTCVAVNCEACLLQDCCFGDDGNISFNAEKTIEIVTQWAKEHPIVTYEQKYEETFGVEPKNDNGTYLCPRYLGFNEVKCESGAYCAHCKDKFWHSEYKPPKKEGE